MGEKSFIKKLAAQQKAKGLQRLRWYCQMCQKQCRDENGFKCHCQSESHRRQLALFATTPSSFVAQFSDTLLSQFIDILRSRFGTKFVKANNVYQEYIKDKHHIHMNSTRWTTLTELVTHLGRQGLCKVEDRDPDGWFIAYIDAEMAARAKRARSMEDEKVDDEARLATSRAKQRRLALERQAQNKHSGQTPPEEDTSLHDQHPQPALPTLPVQFTLKRKPGAPGGHNPQKKVITGPSVFSQMRKAQRQASQTPLPQRERTPKTPLVDTPNTNQKGKEPPLHRSSAIDLA